MPYTEEYNLFRGLLFRFLRGFVAGAIGSLAAMTPISFQSPDDIKAWLFLASLAAISGGLTGGILVLDKYLRVKTPE